MGISNNKPKSLQSNTGVSAFAREIGVSITTVSKKRLAGKTDDQIRQEALAWKTRLDKEETRIDEETLSEAILRKEIALANLNELKVATGRGEVAPIAEINAFVSGMILRARDILTRIAPELRDRLAKETDPIRIQELIDAEVLRALTQLSAFKGGA